MIRITTKENSFLLNGIEYQKGALSINHFQDGISVNGNVAKYDEITGDGNTFSSKDELSDWLSSNLFKNGGGSGVGGAVESVNGETGVVVLNFATVAQGVLADNAVPTSKLNTGASVDTVPLRKSNGRVEVGTSVDGADAINRSELIAFGSAMGEELARKADLEGGKVPESQLPSYIDNVQEYTNLAAFPNTGESNVVYLAIDTNKPYRWGSTVYVEITSGIALGETMATAYRGDRGKVAYDHSQLTTGNPHNVTAAQVGLGNVNDVSAAQLRDRSTHTGTQAISTITDLVTIISAINTANDAQTLAISGLQSSKQNTLVSGTNIKSINGISPLGAGFINTNAPIANPVVTNNIKKSEYYDRFEYTCKIPFNITVVKNNYNSITSSFILPVGVTIDGSDEHYISVRNSSRTIGVAVYDTPSRAIYIGFHNYWSEDVTVTGSVFVKLVKYK